MNYKHEEYKQSQERIKIESRINVIGLTPRNRRYTLDRCTRFSNYIWLIIGVDGYESTQINSIYNLNHRAIKNHNIEPGYNQRKRCDCDEL